MKDFEDKYYTGRRPNGIYIPRFRNIGGKTDSKRLPHEATAIKEAHGQEVHGWKLSQRDGLRSWI